MTAILMPDTPAPLTAKLSGVRFGGDLTPPNGGAVQRIIRLGSRFQCALSMPVMTIDQASAWIAAALKSDAAAAPLSFLLPQAYRSPMLGAPLVNGVGQSGTTLVTDGFAAGQIIPALTFFCFSLNNRSYLHCVTDAVEADGSGAATLSIAPMLRVSPADDAVLNFSAPRIEGWVQGSTVDWQLDLLTYHSTSFTVQEAE